jgi:hypothetical protein
LKYKIAFSILFILSFAFLDANATEYQDELQNYSITPTDFWTPEVYGNDAQDRYVNFYAAQQSGFVDFPPYFQINKIGTILRDSPSDFNIDSHINTYYESLFDGFLTSSQTIDVKNQVSSMDCPDTHCIANSSATLVLNDGGMTMNISMESVFWISSSGNLFAITFFAGENDFDKTVSEFRKSVKTFIPLEDLPVAKPDLQIQPIGEPESKTPLSVAKPDSPASIESTSTPEKGGGCLIATATYGSELAPQVQQLRELRDNTLLQTKSGTSFMNTFNDFYYSFSPAIADYERENPLFKETVKLAITPLISSLSILNYVDMNSESKVLGYGISLIVLNLAMYVGIPASVFIRIKKKF